MATPSTATAAATTTTTTTTTTTATPIRNWKLTPSSSTSAGKNLFSSITKTKTLLLTDWWLVKAEVGSNGGRLRVGGNTRKGPAIRVFCSGAIAKRHDNVTLETIDGFKITLIGLINRSRTLKNGFASEVCDHFILGFPYDWEEFGAQYFGEGSTYGTLPSKNTNSYGIKMTDDGAKSLLPISFDDLPVTRVRDHMMLPSGDYKECRLTRSIFDQMLKIYGGSSVQSNEENNGQVLTRDPLLNETGRSLNSNEENNSPARTKNCLLDEALRDQVKNKVKHRYKDNNDISDATPMRAVESQSIHKQSTMGVDVHRLCKGVCTRSKKRSITLRNNQERGLSSNTSTKPVSTSEAVGSQFGGTIAEKKASNVGRSAILFEESIEVAEIVDRSGVQKSSWPKHLGEGVATRRDSRTEVSKDNTYINPGLSEPLSTSKVSKIQCIDTMTDTNTSNESLSDKSCQEKVEVETLRNSAARGSCGHKNFSTSVSTSQTIHCESAMSVDVHKLIKGVSPRIKNRSKTLRNSHEEGLHSKTSTRPISNSEASGNECGGMIAGTNVSNVSRAAILSEENNEVAKILDSSGVGRSSRPKHLGGGVATIRESRLEISINKQEENLSSTTFGNPELSAQFSASEVSENQCGGTITNTNASNVSLPDKLSQEKTEETLDNSAARLSYQQKNFSTGVFTRSKARLIRLRSDPEDNIVEVEVPVDDSAVRRSAHGKKLSVPFPTSEPSGITKRDASCRQLFQEKKEINGASDRSAVRRSNRIRNLKQ